ncbi:MAG: nucleotidyltransferase family protein [Clostridia bacterium]|nr:nucleotidyltransferase family protein [Clostridia bacterium]
MEICAIICEFNPFHNGHKYLIERAKEITGCGAAVCVMSGSFTQRGDICRTDKFLRAKHAILCGADAVLELPAPFAVAPAEIFARGAVKIIAALPEVKYIAFGCEGLEPCEGFGACGDGGVFESAAEILCNESVQFKSALNAALDGGESYIRSVEAAFEKCGGAKGLLSSPNNILGVEYAKAVKKSGAHLRLVPVKRVGAGYSDGRLSGSFSSARGIRLNSGNPAVKDSMPECSYVDFIASRNNTERFNRMAVDYLFMCHKENLKRVYGCTEGLENRLKNLAFGNGFEQIVEAAASKRYSKSRIRRILCGNLLGLYADETEQFLQSDLPVNILAVKKDRADELLPLLTISGNGGLCREVTSRSYALWRYLSAPLIYDNPNEKMILI